MLDLINFVPIYLVLVLTLSVYGIFPTLCVVEINKSKTCLILSGGQTSVHIYTYIFHIIVDIFSLLCDVYSNKCLQSFSLEPPEIVVIYF